MGDSLFFQTLYLRDGRSLDPPGLSDLSEAVSAAGWQPKDALEDADWVSLDVAHGDLAARVSVPPDEGWAVSVPDSQLQWADGRPDDEAQALVVDLVRKLLVTQPPYVGVSCWPFGPSVPEVYDLTTPFVLREVGSIMFLSDQYLSLQLPGVDFVTAPVRWQERLAGGVFWVADQDVLRSADGGDLDELRAFFGLPPAGGR